MVVDEHKNEFDENQMTNETEQTQNNASESKAEEPVSTPEKTVFPADKIEDDFDWESLSEEQINYSEKSREEYEKMYEDTLNIIVEKELINGTIVAKNNREVIVNIGYKSDGVIPISEFKDLPEIKIGDQIEVFIESQEDLTGQLILSHKKAKALKSWEKVNDSLEQGTIINGYVKCRTKGGLIVEIFGIEAFLPGSQIDIKPIRDYDIYVGKTLELKVVKINNEYKNVVVSHKALIEAELEQQKAEIISRLEKGQVLEGTVKNITSYGVFIDLGGIDGLVHITDLTWGRITHPEEVVKLDEKLKVVILDFDENMKRIALGLKQLTPHPWDALDPELKVGDKTKGKVVVIADYGAFIEIVPGVEGLIHVSEMSWSQHLRSAQDFLKINDEVEAVILTLDREGRKMSLGMKQLIPDPWTNIVEKYPVNSKHKAKVRNFTAFGIFVELEEGVDGLIHISDLSWSKKIKHPAEFTKINEELDVIVLDIDSSNRRLSLGHKQLEENPWEVFETIFTLDSVHRGTITQIVDKGAIVNLEYGVEGFVPQRHLIKENKMSAIVDETLDFKVIEFSKENKKIILSHSKIHLDEQASKKSQQDNTKREDDKGTKKALKKVKDNIEKTTLGDLGILGDLKTDLENKERAKAKQKRTKTEEKPVETAEPKAIAPETAEPKAIAPETTEPKAIAPETAEPEAIAPETTEPETKIEPTAEEEKNKPENQE